MLAIFCALIYTSIVSFSNVSVGLITEVWLEDSEQSEIIAGRMNGIAWAIAAITTPLFGYTIDSFGYRAILVIILWKI
jgi:hypothetical protein